MVDIIRPGQGERCTGSEVNIIIHIATLNVCSMRGWSDEIVEMLSRRQSKFWTSNQIFKKLWEGVTFFRGGGVTIFIQKQIKIWNI